jgi:PEP-CTERM motif
MKQIFRMTAVACAALLSTVQANAATITFEDLAVGAILSNQYAGLGAIFSANAFSGPGTSSSGEAWATNTGMRIVSSTGTDVGGLGTPALVSGNILRSFDDWLAEDGDPSFAINFTTSINSFSATFAGVSTGADVSIYAYNGATLLGSVNGTGTGQFVLSFAAANITKIAVRPGSFNDWVGVDNINFTPNVAGAVPEPESWVLMLAGFGAMGIAMRRARRVTVSYA